MTLQDQLYEEAVAAHAPALERLARSYELDREKRRDLLQDVHLALWRSFAGFEGQCSLRTWIYRVAHNVAATHVARHRRQRARGLVSLDDIAALPVDDDADVAVDRRKALDQLYALIHRLKPLEREVILLYLEGLDAASIGEITGISASNAATRIHRIKKILTTRFQEGDPHAR
ncbi:MAG TPA: sigma-70 family RNA polymerase sigma factor [Thermoanaerobaculia bacterium]|nr:sigma-70 family RNA polymerase sigma factor [Thermoanaerobaculia bacterium]